MQRAVGRNRAELFRKAGRLFVRAALWGGEVLREVAAPLSAAARGVSDTLPSSRAKCSLRGALRGGSAASGPASIGRQAEQNGPERRPALPSVSLSGRRWGRGSLARSSRVPVRRRTRRFGHFALKPGKVFAPRRTTRRRCRVWPGLHWAAGREKWARAPPCFATPPSPPPPFFRPHFPGLPRLRPADPRGPLRAPRAKTGEIRLFCDISVFVNRICF